MNQPLHFSIPQSSSGIPLLGPCLFLLLRLQYTIAATATINSTKRTTANGANNIGQRLAEAIGLMLVGLVEGEGIALPGRLAEVAEGTGVIPMKATHIRLAHIQISLQTLSTTEGIQCRKYPGYGSV